ncbi:hypothetical protein LIA77_04775 [Sarocladium implicatum]|nr:hypothetical protein LIA77_04775 [Sarocladium implicatum]
MYVACRFDVHCSSRHAYVVSGWQLQSDRMESRRANATQVGWMEKQGKGRRRKERKKGQDGSRSEPSAGEEIMCVERVVGECGVIPNSEAETRMSDRERGIAGVGLELHVSLVPRTRRQCGLIWDGSILGDVWLLWVWVSTVEGAARGRWRVSDLSQDRQGPGSGPGLIPVPAPHLRPPRPSDASWHALQHAPCPVRRPVSPPTLAGSCSCCCPSLHPPSLHSPRQLWGPRPPPYSLCTCIRPSIPHITSQHTNAPLVFQPSVQGLTLLAASTKQSRIHVTPSPKCEHRGTACLSAITHPLVSPPRITQYCQKPSHHRPGSRRFHLG